MLGIARRIEENVVASHTLVQPAKIVKLVDGPGERESQGEAVTEEVASVYRDAPVVEAPLLPAYQVRQRDGLGKRVGRRAKGKAHWRTEALCWWFVEADAVEGSQSGRLGFLR